MVTFSYFIIALHSLSLAGETKYPAIAANDAKCSVNVDFNLIVMKRVDKQNVTGKSP